MLLSFIVALIPLLIHPACAAPDDRMAYFWQPLSGKSSVSLQYMSSRQTFATDDSNGNQTKSTQITTTAFTPTFGFGLSSDWSFAAQVASYGNNNSEITSATGGNYSESAVGVDDPLISIQNTTRLGQCSLYFGSFASVSIDHLLKESQSQVGNRSTGGPTLAPYIGFSYSPNNRQFYGARLSYIYIGERIETDSGNGNKAGPDSIIDGGSQLKFDLVGEFHILSFYFSTSLIYNYTQPVTTVVDLTTLSSAGFPTYSAALNLGFMPSADWTLILALDETIVPTRNASINQLQSHMENTSTGAVRYEF